MTTIEAACRSPRQRTGQPERGRVRTGACWALPIIVNLLAAPYADAALLDASRAQALDGDTFGGSDAARYDWLGRALTTGDFDGDGIEDLAVGVPRRDLRGHFDGGAVRVVYGSGGGLSASRTQLWHQDSGSLEGAVEPYDQFGFSLAAGDFDRDGYDDLAIGLPFEDIEALENAGAVQVLYGGPLGLDDDRNEILVQGISGLPGVAEPGDEFGFAVAVGHFNNDDYADLAVGVPLEDLEGGEVPIVNAGGVLIVHGHEGGLDRQQSRWWDQDSRGLRGVSESYDMFGWSLATGDFDGDRRIDLAIGVPYENRGSIRDTGAVQVLYSNARGLTARDQLWDQASSGIAATPEAGDAFGFSLAVMDLTGDGRDDLAIGVPFEDLGDDLGAAGVVQLLYGGPRGLVPGRALDQSQSMFEAKAEPGDRFGWSLAGGDFDGSGADELTVGTPFEKIGNDADDAGVVFVVGRRGADWTAEAWHQDVEGVPGIAENGDLMGFALAVGDFDGDGADDLAAGTPKESIRRNTLQQSGAVSILYGKKSPVIGTAAGAGR